jgi:glycosyltransferase involved in cell wall biosynthesis
MSYSRTKILFLIPSLAAGGAERVIANLVRYLDKSKFEVVLAVISLRSEVFLKDIPPDVEVIDLKCSRVRFAVFKILRLVWVIRPDVLFSTLGHLNLLLAILKFLMPKNILYLSREATILSEELSTESNSHYWKWAYSYFYNHFDKIICQSRHMRDDLKEHFGVLPDKLIVINNPVDIERVRNLATELTVTKVVTHGGNDGKIINLVSAGRLVNVKGFDLLIEALALHGNPDIHLTLLGDGPLKEELQALAKTLGVEQQVHFVGYQKNPYSFIAQADAYVLSSRFEGFPNVVLEALACGTPVIATPAVGGTKEILEGMEGCLLTNNVSAEALAEALSSFVFGKRLSPELIKPYAIDRIVNLYEQQFLL